MHNRWSKVTLGEVTTIINGGTPSTNNADYWGGEIVWITTTELTAADGKRVNFSRRTITQNSLVSGSARMVRAGTTLVGTTATIGTCAMASCDLAFNQQISGLTPRINSLDDVFLFYWIQYSKPIIESFAAGTSFKRISTSVLKTIPVNYPPLPEQKRIVDLISSVDSYIEALQQQLESAKRSRNAVLHELLTAGGEGWETTTIGDISDFVSVRKSPEQLPSDSIYVGLEHLEPNNTSINSFDSVSKVTSSLAPFDVGDILFGRLRPYLHKVAIAEMFGFCSPEILVLRANSKVLPQMLLLFCDADSTIKICIERSAGTRMPRTSTEDLASIEIKLPPIAEQIKLAELSSTFDTEISYLGNVLEKSKILRSGLISDLLSGTHEIPASYDKVMGVA